MPRLRPFFSYYGSKWRISGKYPAPTTNTIIEPFAGGATYALRYHDKQVILNDLDPILATTWRYLIETPEADILALPDLAEGQSVDDLDIPQGARYLIGFWLNKGKSSPGKTMGAWMRKAQGTPQATQFWGPKIRQRIAHQQQYIRHWRVTNLSYADLADVEATYYVDPPYQGRAGTYYRCSSKGFDYSALAAWCQSRQGQVIVAENAGADWLPFSHLCDAKSIKADLGEHRSKEVIWTNA